jgi:hypothetical protein
MYGVLKRIGDYMYEDLIWCKSFEEAEEMALMLGGKCNGRVITRVEAGDVINGAMEKISEQEDTVVKFLVLRVNDEGFEVFDVICARNWEDAKSYANMINASTVIRALNEDEDDVFFRQSVKNLKGSKKVYWYYEKDDSVDLCC